MKEKEEEFRRFLESEIKYLKTIIKNPYIDQEKIYHELAELDHILIRFDEIFIGTK